VARGGAYIAIKNGAGATVVVFAVQAVDPSNCQVLRLMLHTLQQDLPKRVCPCPQIESMFSCRPGVAKKSRSAHLACRLSASQKARIVPEPAGSWQGGRRFEASGWPGAVRPGRCSGQLARCSGGWGRRQQASCGANAGGTVGFDVD
jgi:hypothetical protein